MTPRRPFPAAGARLGAAWRRCPLWARLITVMFTLVATALALTTLFGSQLLSGYLQHRVDEQLLRTVRQAPPGGLASPSGPPPMIAGSGMLFVLGPQGSIESDAGRPPPGQSGPDPDALSRVAAAAPASAPPPERLATIPADDPDSEPWRVITAARGGPRGGPGSGAEEGRIAVAVSLAGVDSTVSRLNTINLAISAATLLVLTAAGYLLVRAALRPLNEVEDTAVAIAAGDLSRRVPERPAGTEVGRISGAFNGMLAQIERAFRERAESERSARESEQRMRRFVADAGHELRTPLTSIRGYAELHRQAGHDPSGAAVLLERIEEEAHRMSALVEDLLLLARLDQQRPIAREPVDVFQLAADAVLDARARAPQRELELLRIAPRPGGPGTALESDPVAPVMVVGDGARLRQALDNLVNNALTHTPAGSPVEVRVGRYRDLSEEDDPDTAVVRPMLLPEGEPVVIEVADRGPGIAEADVAYVFERFFRSDPARERGGAGLGLSIVAALAAGHGGAVELRTSPGSGSTFRLVLPAERP